MLQSLSSRDPHFFENAPSNASSINPDWLENGHLKNYSDIVGPAGDNAVFNTAAFHSTAGSWLSGVGVDVPGFNAATIAQANIFNHYTYSTDEYKSTVLKGH
ncbi:hypothetical protein AB0L57_29625 [Nocardia sp. NPDC052254]|uniref:hypothetical protein n=1 Tax=Nocardia sp. NPDC052254 TaxID=3155681 RepID=UPI0034435B99